VSRKFAKFNSPTLRGVSIFVSGCGLPFNTQEALQMQRDHETRHKYEISHLKRLTIGELPSKTLKVIIIAAIR